LPFDSSDSNIRYCLSNFSLSIHIFLPTFRHCRGAFIRESLCQHKQQLRIGAMYYIKRLCFIQWTNSGLIQCFIHWTNSVLYTLDQFSALCIGPILGFMHWTNSVLYTMDQVCALYIGPILRFIHWTHCGPILCFIYWTNSVLYTLDQFWANYVPYT